MIKTLWEVLICSCNKKKSDERMNVSAEKCTCSFLQNVIKFKQYRVSFRHNEWSRLRCCVCVMKCTTADGYFRPKAPRGFHNGELS